MFSLEFKVFNCSCEAFAAFLASSAAFFCSLLIPKRADFILSKFAINAPTATTRAPIPVAIKAPRKPFKPSTKPFMPFTPDLKPFVSFIILVA